MVVPEDIRTYSDLDIEQIGLIFRGRPGGGGGTGGGLPGTGSGTAGLLPNNENGGVFASTWLLLVPSTSSISGLSYLGYYDTDTFDDPLDGFHYSYRAEDISPDQTPTVNRVILTYRDLGRARITVLLAGSNDDGLVISASKEVMIGNTIPTFALLTRQVDISLTGFRPQLSVSRKPGDGPVCIVANTMKGECEEEV